MEGRKYKIKTNLRNDKYCEYSIETTNIQHIIEGALRNDFQKTEESDIRVVFKKEKEMVIQIFKRKNIIKIQSRVDSFSNNWKKLVTF